MSLILDDFGDHIQMHKMNEDGKDPKPLFPTNTISDVIADNFGNTLSQYLPTIQDSAIAPTTSSPMLLVETGTDVIPDSVLANILR